MMFRPILRVVFFPLLAAAAILTQTRGIWIAGLGLLLVVAMPWLARGRVRLAGALVAVVAVSLVVEPQVTSLLELNPNTRPYRVATISEGLELIEENPVFGVGWAAGTASLPESLAPPYNLWVNTAASVGIPGLLILGGFLFLLVKAAYSAAGAVPRTLLAYLGAFLILSLGEMTLYANSPLTIEFFTLSGIGLAFTTAGADRKYSPGQELPVGSPPSSRPLPR